MTIERKVGMGIAGQPSGDAANVADVFSTTVYTANNTGQTITNGIDLAGEGGLVWTKARDGTVHSALTDTVRGNTKYLKSGSNAIEATTTVGITAFNNNGYSLGADNTWLFNVNNSYISNYVSWTFRKKEKFFTCLTYTGNGVSGREIAHSLDTDIGMIVIKRTDSTNSWVVGHRGSGSYWASATLRLNTTAQGVSNGEFNALTASYFKVTNAVDVNANGGTYVAYVFADNSSEDAEDQMIKCGSYTGSSSDVVVNLGWEPQFVLIKNATSSSNWAILDTLRGMPHGDGNSLVADGSAAENGALGADNLVNPIADGFIAKSGKTATNQNSSSTHIYMAIRAPMMKEPEAATDVFAVTTRNVANDSKAPEFKSTFPVDMALRKWNTTDHTLIVSRLNQAKSMQTATTSAEVNFSSAMFDYNNGWSSNASGANTDLTSWMWKRAKGYMDCVCYSGNATSGRTVAHSLSVVPEMIWVKARDSGGQSWRVYNASSGATHGLNLNGDNAAFALNRLWNDTAPTNSSFTVGNHGSTNDSSLTYIAYLFATLAGISKVGSYTGNGSYQTINCGFSAGSRFILIKRTDATGDWYVWDSVRGIVAGNDPHFILNTNAGDVTNDDSIDPANAGFIVNQVSATNINVSSGTYIFYAIA